MKFKSLKVYKQTNDIVYDTIDKEILHGLIDGLPVKDISDKVNISPRTVEGRISKMIKVLGAKCRVDMVLKAVIEHQIVEYKTNKKPLAVYDNTTPFGIANTM